MSIINKIRNALNELDTFREGTEEDPQGDNPVVVDHENTIFQLFDPVSNTLVTLQDLYTLIEEASK